MSNGVFFVDEFDGEDGLGGVEGNGFFDAGGGGQRVSDLLRVLRGSLTANHAYAPCPIVLDTTLNGTALGRGASWEWAIILRALVANAY